MRQAAGPRICGVLRVEVGEGYPVWVTRGGVAQAESLLSSLATPLMPGPWALVTDATLAELHGKRLRSGLPGWGPETTLLVPSGEKAKTWRVAGESLRRLARAELGRDRPVVCLGGGSVGDLGGFVAATYLRGVSFVNVPSTLLAMVDASIGGKTGVDLPEGKNLAGAFHHPSGVLVDLDLLATLPAPEWRNGWAEILKVAMTSDPALFELLESRGPSPDGATLEDVVQRACRVKASIVAADERDAGARMVLNFGHTVGHAIEAAGDFARFSHGEAVALGMACALELGRRLRVTPPAVALRCRRLIGRFGLPLRGSGLGAEALKPFLRRDKKARDGWLAVLLTVEIGKSIIRRLSPDDPDLEAAIRSVA